MVGLIFNALVRQSNGLSAVTSNAALFLGVMLFILGLATLFLNTAQTITIDPQRRWVLIETATRLGKQRKTIWFRDIVEATLGELGDDEGGSITYFIQLRLKNGKEANLFVGWMGENWDRAEMEAKRQRLISYLEESA